MEPGVVVHVCNPIPQEAEAGDCKFEASLSYVERPYFKTKK
jgi:hypothetical protein